MNLPRADKLGLHSHSLKIGCGARISIAINSALFTRDRKLSLSLTVHIAFFFRTNEDFEQISVK